jgi:hypothetical protein
MRTRVLFCTAVGLGLAGLAGLLGCGAEEFFGCDFDNDASPGVQGTLEKVAGDGGTAVAGVPVELAVYVADIDGETLCETGVTWAAAANSGTVDPAQSATGDSGVASTIWTPGPTPGTQTVTATVTTADPPLSVTFTATVTAGVGGSHPKAQIGAYNGTSTPGVTVTMQTPYDGQQSFGPLAQNVQASDSLQVEVGVAFQITVTVGAQSGSITCTTLPAIIPNSNDPVNTGNALVAVFTDGGVFLTCNGAWASVAAGARSTGPRVPRGTARSVVP